MATVIDSLIVTLGLDASNYKKGREQAQRETAETSRQVKLSAEAITKSLVEVGRTISGLFLGFESISGFAKFLGDLNAGEAALGRTAANLGMSAHELNKWGDAAALAGGSAEDAQAAFSQLTKEFTTFSTGAGPSGPLLNLLRARGVNILDENGKLRNQGIILEELATKTARFGRVWQQNAFTAAGLAQGEVNYLVQNVEARREQLLEAERANMVSEESVRGAQELQQHWRAIGQEITAAGQALLVSITPTLDTIFKALGGINSETDEFTTGLKLIGSAAIFIKNIFLGLGDAIGGAAAAAGAALHGNFREAKRILDDQSARSKERNSKEVDDFIAVWNSPAAKAAAAVAAGTTPAAVGTGNLPDRNFNPGNLRDTRTGQFRTFTNEAEGDAALRADLDAKIRKGFNTISSIVNRYAPASDNNDVPAYIAALVKQTGHGAGEMLNAGDVPALAAAIAKHEGSTLYGLQSGPTPGIAGGSNVARNGGTHETTVTVGTINVNAPSADPSLVAAQIPAALQRKMTTSQVDLGQT